MTIDLFADVARFNRACDVRLRHLPGWVSDEEVALAMALIAEELNELDTALEQRDLIEAADAVADSLYVAAGLALRLGIGRRYITDIIKDAPAGWIGFGDDEQVEQMREDLTASHARLIMAVENESLMATDSAVHDLMFGVSAVGFALGLPMGSSVRGSPAIEFVESCGRQGNPAGGWEDPEAADLPAAEHRCRSRGSRLDGGGVTVMYLRQHLAADGTGGVELVNPQPRIPVSKEFLDAELDYLTRDGDTFTLHCLNGTWTYRILPQKPWAPSQSLLAVLIEEEAA